MAFCYARVFITERAMDKQHIIQALAPLGEPVDNQAWVDYSRYGVSVADAQTLVDLIADESFLEYEGNDYWIPLHAWRALKALMPVGLHELIGIFDVLVEDEWALEEIPQVIAAAKAQAIAPLFASLMDEENDELVRMFSANCLSDVVKATSALRAPVVEKFATALQNFTGDDEALAGIVVAALMEIKAVEVIGTIRQAFAEERVSWSICGDLEDVELGLGLRTERDTPRPRYNGFDVVKDKNDNAFADDDRPVVQQVIRTEPKVGRNDPCPCGSGKKYKKCCLVA
jgi:hypothetical protein